MKPAVLRKGTVSERDRKEGYYWELDGEKQNQCPRRHIKENPEWWNSVISAYNAYEKGFLPAKGALDDQPAMFMPIMATISSALHLEDEHERGVKQRQQNLVEQSRSAQPETAPGYAPLTVPRRGR